MSWITVITLPEEHDRIVKLHNKWLKEEKRAAKKAAKAEAKAAK